MSFSYLTIKQKAEGIYKEKGSKFLAFAYPVDSEEAVKERIETLKKKYFDARHHCFAWMIGVDKSRFRSFDDGEPGHTAGDPILGQIRSNQLTNIVVVVVRYFGGVKLGVSGLITAYREAARDALGNAIIIEKEIIKSFHIEYPYSATKDILKMVNDCNLKVGEQQFMENCILQVEVPMRSLSVFEDRINVLKQVLMVPLNVKED